MKKKDSHSQEDVLNRPSTYAERLGFVIWLAVYELGVDGATKLSKAIGKGENTLSKWAQDQPSYELSKLVATAVKVSPSWLHDPTSPDAVEHPWFAQWLRQGRLAAAASETGDVKGGKSRRGA